MRRFALLVLLVLGCRSYKDDVDTICNAEEYLEDKDKPLYSESSHPKKAGMLLAAVEKKIKTDEGKKLLAEIKQATPAVAVNELRTESSKQGIATCALSDFYEKAPKPGPPPPPEPSVSASASSMPPPKKEVSLLTVGDTTVTGKLAVEPIKSVIRANVSKLRPCYADAVKRDESLTGTMTVKLTITAAGAIENAAVVGGTIKDPLMRKCIVAAYQSLTFPLPEKGKAQVTSTVDYQPAF